jgi:hypothetical protein
VTRVFINLAFTIGAFLVVVGWGILPVVTAFGVALLLAGAAGWWKTRKSRSRRSAETPRREGVWFLGCLLAAVLFCALNNDYGYAPAPFFAVALYMVTWVIRKIISLAIRPRGL